MPYVPCAVRGCGTLLRPSVTYHTGHLVAGGGTSNAGPAGGPCAAVDAGPAAEAAGAVAAGAAARKERDHCGRSGGRKVFI
eukprot:6241177-Amphidinium_carterae.1